MLPKINQWAAVALLVLCALAIEVNARQCYRSGVKLRNGTFEPGSISKAFAFERLRNSAVNCSAGEKCFECSWYHYGGFMMYESLCAKPENFTSTDVCSASPEPCTEFDEAKCQPQFTAIRRLNKCLYGEIKNSFVVAGGGHVYCNESCASAVYYENNTIHMCQSCSSHCQRWLENRMGSNSARFCEGAAECRIEGMPWRVAMSDEGAQADAAEASRAAQAIVVAALGLTCLAKLLPRWLWPM